MSTTFAHSSIRRSSRANAGKKTEYKGMTIIPSKVATRGKKRQHSTKGASDDERKPKQAKTCTKTETTQAKEDKKQAAVDPWAPLYQHLESDNIQPCPRTGIVQPFQTADPHFPHQNKNGTWCCGMLGFRDEDGLGSINGEPVTPEQWTTYNTFFEKFTEHAEHKSLMDMRDKNIATIKDMLPSLKLAVWDFVVSEEPISKEVIKAMSDWIKQDGHTLTARLPKTDKEMNAEIKDMEIKAVERDVWLLDHHDPVTGDCKHPETEMQFYCPAAHKWAEKEHDEEGQCRSNHKNHPMFKFCPKNHVARVMAENDVQREFTMTRCDEDTIAEFLPEFAKRILAPIGGIEGKKLDKIDDKTAHNIAQWILRATDQMDDSDE